MFRYEICGKFSRLKIQLEFFGKFWKLNKMNNELFFETNKESDLQIKTHIRRSGVKIN